MPRFVDRRSFGDFGFLLDRQWRLDVGFGLAPGALLMTGIFLSMQMLSWVAITGWRSKHPGRCRGRVVPSGRRLG